MKVGKLYSLSFYQSEPWLLTAAGASNDISVWDLTREAMIRNAFAERFVGGAATLEDEEEKLTKDADFEAMMAVQEESTQQNTKIKSATKKNKKKKTKKKVYKKQNILLDL